MVWWKKILSGCFAIVFATVHHACIAVECDDYKCWRTLSIGGISFRAFDAAQTSPALHIMDSEGSTWHVSFAPDGTENVVSSQLHTQYNGVTYSAIDSIYEIVNGRLVWAHPDIYLESSGTQYIDTGIKPSDSKGVKLSYQYVGDGTMVLADSRQIHMGVESNQNAQSSTHARFSLGTMSSPLYGWGAYYNVSDLSADARYVAALNYKNDRLVSYNGVTYGDLTFTHPGLNYSVYLFCSNAKGKTANCSAIKIYSAVITDGAETIMHLVPVPAGMVIGDYTVPSNGMFDIVSQKFYGNSGSGTFTYGTEF